MMSSTLRDQWRTKKNEPKMTQRGQSESEREALDCKAGPAPVKTKGGDACYAKLPPTDKKTTRVKILAKQLMSSLPTSIHRAIILRNLIAV